ncbi:hypothetical protein TNCV_2431761 [Trichonephila clavipes]|nr:hypothetical protein TNCV_2431761 [Trichonephila clavipes]
MAYETTPLVSVKPLFLIHKHGQTWVWKKTWAFFPGKWASIAVHMGSLKHSGFEMMPLDTGLKLGLLYNLGDALWWIPLFFMDNVEVTPPLITRCDKCTQTLSPYLHVKRLDLEKETHGNHPWT